jgi:hypothetical protein
VLVRYFEALLRELSFLGRIIPCWAAPTETTMTPHDRAPQPNAEKLQPEGSTATHGRISRWGEQSRVLWAVIALLFVVLLLEISNEVSRHRTTLASIPEVTAIPLAVIGVRPSPPETTGQSAKSEAPAASPVSAPSDFARRWALTE